MLSVLRESGLASFFGFLSLRQTPGGNHIARGISLISKEIRVALNLVLQMDQPQNVTQKVADYVRYVLHTILIGLRGGNFSGHYIRGAYQFRSEVISFRANGDKLVDDFILMMTLLESYVASQKLTEGADLCTSIISQLVLLLTFLGEAGQCT